MTDRLVTHERNEDDLDASLRPKRLADFVGQQQARENLSVFIDAAKARGEALDHVLFYGPPGLGKTTLAQIVARELGVNFRSTSGPVLAKAGDLAAILTNLEARDVQTKLQKLRTVLTEAGIFSDPSWSATTTTSTSSRVRSAARTCWRSRGSSGRT